MGRGDLLEIRVTFKEKKKQEKTKNTHRFMITLKQSSSSNNITTINSKKKREKINNKSFGRITNTHIYTLIELIRSTQKVTSKKRTRTLR